jgi:hypothetical protein
VAAAEAAGSADAVGSEDVVGSDDVVGSAEAVDSGPVTGTDAVAGSVAGVAAGLQAARIRAPMIKTLRYEKICFLGISFFLSLLLMVALDRDLSRIKLFCW